MKIVKIIVLLLSLSLISCSREDETQTASIRLNLTANAEVLAITTKAAEPQLMPEMFKVRFEDQNKNLLKTWNSYTEMPTPTRINAGTYRIVAWYGSNKLPAWDTPYYEGALDFVIAQGEAKDLNVTCTLAATKVQVNFDSSFDVHYSSYSVDIRTSQVESEFLNFDPTNQGRAAYFTPGVMNIRFRLTSKAGGETIFYSAPPITQTLARESYTLNMSAKVTQGIGTITIVTDESTNDKPIDIEIPRN